MGLRDRVKVVKKNKRGEPSVLDITDLTINENEIFLEGVKDRVEAFDDKLRIIDHKFDNKHKSKNVLEDPMGDSF